MSVEFGDQVMFLVDPQAFWTAAILGLILLLALAAFGMMSHSHRSEDAPQPYPLQIRMGLEALPNPAFLLGALLWGLILTLLVLGLVWTIISAGFYGLASEPANQTAFRFVLISLAALTATTGAVVAFPITLIRIGLTRAQTKTAEEALFNDKINAAAEGLAARREVTRIVGEGTEERILTEQEDDLVTRASAIDRLEGLAGERPKEAARIARMLSIYVRELSREFQAFEPPKDAKPGELREWARTLKPIRPDMEKAAQSLGRLQRIKGHNIAPGDIDLRHANLQGFDLQGLKFEDARLNEAQMQGANLFRAQMQGANLSGAKMQGAILNGAEMQGAILIGAKMDENTDLSIATLRGAMLRSVDNTTLTQLRPFWPEIYTFGFDQIEGDDRPAHWRPEDAFDWNTFWDEWHAWQETLPEFDPSWRPG